jgi:DNA (cytosine-5)-methyltransferase 1
MGYKIDVAVVNVKNYGIPQNRKRLVMICYHLGQILIAKLIMRASKLNHF